MIRVGDVEGILFKITMDRRGVARLKAILMGEDHKGIKTLHDQLLEWCTEYKIDLDKWKGDR